MLSAITEKEATMQETQLPPPTLVKPPQGLALSALIVGIAAALSG